MLGKLSVASSLEPKDFCERYGYLVANCPFLEKVPTPEDIQQRWKI